MKKVLFTLIMLPLAYGAMAQKLDIGAGAGLNQTLKPSFGMSGDKGASAPLIYAQASLKVLGFQFGLRGEYTSFKFKGSTKNWKYGSVPAGEDYVDLVYGDKAFNIRAFVNKTFAISRIEPYVGINLGYTSSSASVGKIDNTSYGVSDNLAGFTGGVQAGLTVFVTGKLGVNGQVGLDYYNLNSSVAGSKTGSMLAPNVTLGLRYRIL